MAPEERSKRAKSLEKSGRIKRVMRGICSRCRKYPPVEGKRMCLRCQERGRKYVMKSSLKKRGGLDEW